MGIYSPHYDEFPSDIKSLDDAEWKEFGTIMDDIDAELILSITGMRDFYDPDKCPKEFLEFLSFSIQAGIYASDPENVKRKKIWTAIAKHRTKAREIHILGLIEEITGITPVVISNIESVNMIWESKNSLMEYPHDFMKWVSKNDLEFGGMCWSSKNSGSVGGRGVIYIDVKVSPITAALIGKLINLLENVGAAYFRYIVGYVDGNRWVEYATIF